MKHRSQNKHVLEYKSYSSTLNTLKINPTRSKIMSNNYYWSTEPFMRLLLKPLPKHKYKVMTNYHYKDITVPKGYTTNGANIPRLFWSFYPPNLSDIMEAVAVHDYLCDKEQYAKADKYFKELLEYSSLKKFSVYILWGSVKIYHYIKY